MRTSPTKLKLVALTLFSSLALTSTFGQAIYTWTNSAGGNIATAANWDPNGLPSGATQDTALFDGKTVGPLFVFSSGTSLPSTGFGSSGINLQFTANQISSVTFTSTVAQSAAYGVNNIIIDSPNAAITWGGTDLSLLYQFFGRPAGASHAFINNSAQPATINPAVRWQAGGGNAYTLDFQGTGNWVANNYLVNDNNAGMIITVTGPGTTTWNPTGYLGNSGINSPITINAGKLVLAGPHPRISNQAWVNNGAFEFNAPSSAQTLSGAISGFGGTTTVKAGTLTLSSGQSTFFGDIFLQGGSLVVNGAETPFVSGPLGAGGLISFTGGTLVFSVNNVFDYSPRFVATGGQAFSIDTAGQNVTFSDPAGLSGAGSSLTKLGGGTLTLAGPSAYTGSTTISAGRLVFQGLKTGSGNITVADGAGLAVTDTGTQVTPATLTLGTIGGATLGFFNVSSAATAPLRPTTLSSAGTVTVNINSGTLAPGQSYPLLAWTTGPAPAVSLGVLNGFIGNLSTNGNQITLNITATAFKWTGNNNGSWDLTTANNWQQNGGPVLFVNGGPALFDDTLAANSAVTITGIVQPSSVTVNNEFTNYSITTSVGNNLGGSAGVTKSGNGTLTLVGGANTYTGVTTLSDGILSVGTLANGGAPSDIGQAGSGAENLVFDGGGLQFTGGAASVDRLFTLGTGGGLIESAGSGALVLNNLGSLGYLGNGARTLTLGGSSTDANTLAAVIANNGGPTAVTKNGAGMWVLTGTNTYSGVTTIASGELKIGNGGASGAIGSGNVVNNGGLAFNRSGNATVSGAISGTGSITNDGPGAVILTANNSYSGNTVINAGTLQAGNGGATGQLPSGGPIINNGTLIYNTTGSYVSAGFAAGITGTGNVRVQSGFVKSIGNNTYTGWTQIDSGAAFQPTEGNAGNLLSSVVTNNGTLVFGRQDNLVFGYSNNIVGSGRVLKEVNNTQGGGDVTLAGTNSYTGGTLIAGGGLILGDGINPIAGTIAGNVIFTNSPVGDNGRFLRFERPDDFTFTNTISSVSTGGGGNNGRVEKNNINTVILTGNNTYPSGTTVNDGVLQVGNGGASGSIANGGLTINSPGILTWNRSNDVTFTGAVSGTGSMVQRGAGNVTLTTTNYGNFSGSIVISNGTLTISGNTAPGTTNSLPLTPSIELNGGSLVVGGVGSVSQLELGGALFLNSGTVVASLNTSVSPSNTFYSIGGTTVLQGSGTLKLINAGPQLVVGQKFTIFNFPIPGGSTMTIVSPGFTVQNNLETDGSVTVTAVLPPPTISTTVTGNQLNMSWPAAWTGGVHLQGQTNNSALVGLSNNWVSIPGTDLGNTYSATIARTNRAVFYRLIAP